VPKVLGRKRVTELVEVEALAVRACCTPITMFGYALAAVEFRSMRDSLYHLDVETVRPSLGVRKINSAGVAFRRAFNSCNCLIMAAG
jgi:hypothetical protein